MSKDIKLAFGDLEARAEDMADGLPLDRISLRDYGVDVEIGAFQAERGATQRILFNVVVEVARHVAPLDDDVDRILSYDTITDAITAELAAERLNLLETLADRVAARVLLSPLAHRIFVRIEKLERGPGALGVEIVRTSGGPVSQDSDAPSPRVAYLSNGVIESGRVPALIDRFILDKIPLILTAGSPDVAAPQSKASSGQARIDLLALEQNAWALAGLDPRCAVVGTRTELEWSMRQGQISVWAPSKIVLDAVGGPGADPVDALALAQWFATEVGAVGLTVVGEAPPKAGAVPVDTIDLDSL